MKLLKLLSFSWWITTAKRKHSAMRFWVRWKLSRDEIQKNDVLFQTWTTVLPCQCMLLPTSGKHYSSYTLTFALCPVSTSSFLLLDHSPFLHPPVFSDFSFSHKSPWQIITMEQHSLSQTCPHPSKKQFLHHILSTCEEGPGKTSPPGQKGASCRRGQVPGPTTGRGSSPNQHSFRAIPMYLLPRGSSACLKNTLIFPFFSLSCYVLVRANSTWVEGVEQSSNKYGHPREECDGELKDRDS